jgi:hypothetical protein
MQHNPYTPPVDNWGGQFQPPVPEGSFGLGVFLGFLLGLWGWLGCLLLAKAETKRGAKWGFLSRIGLGALAVLVMLVLR